ncbi:MAG TPA: hypothetical protein VK859_01330, partial [bacterium]|nr:hypothetical protein [bacterium]
MGISLKTNRGHEIAIGMGISLWIGVVFYHYFSIGSVLDFSFIQTVISGSSQGQLQRLAGNWLYFLKTLLTALGAGFLLWRLGRRLVGWIGLKIPHDLPRFCLEMAFGMVLLN